MGEALEIAKVLVEPTVKLIDTARRACGKLYEPRYIKKMADAKAYETKVIAESLRESSDIPIVYDKGDITMDTTEFDEFAKRAQSRMAYQELTKQRNIENVIGNAYELLEGEEAVTDEPVNSDWIIRFFNSVEDISDTKMQRFWGKLLAGEIKEPRSFSLRTLDVLRNLTSHDADIFSAIAPFVLHCPGDIQKSFMDWFLISDMLGEDTYLEKHGIRFPMILLLNECGLISTTTNSVLAFVDVNPGEEEYIYGHSHNIKIINNGESKKRIAQAAYLLTEAGKQLLPIAIECGDVNVDLEYYDECAITLLDCTDTKYTYIKECESIEVIVE